jgi:hypothetical protein
MNILSPCKARWLIATAVATGILSYLAAPASAQSPGPGWLPTGEWQCGPVRIVASVDGFGAVNFQINGAWFDNNYTLRRGQLYYNGMPCATLGRPMAFATPRKAAANEDEETGSK